MLYICHGIYPNIYTHTNAYFKKQTSTTKKKNLEARSKAIQLSKNMLGACIYNICAKIYAVIYVCMCKYIFI